MISGLTYIPNFITDFQQDYIVSDLDSREWSTELKRRVQHYGYKYNYTERTINESMKAESLLPWMATYGKAFVERGLFTEVPDQVIINEYQIGQGINKHVDCPPCFKAIIASLSLLSGCVMIFRQQERSFQIYLEPKSLLVIDGEARYYWTHEIPARKSDDGIERSRRISATFRNVILQ